MIAACAISTQLPPYYTRRNHSFLTLVFVKEAEQTAVNDTPEMQDLNPNETSFIRQRRPKQAALKEDPGTDQ